jgi:hypothetical protein
MYAEGLGSRPEVVGRPEGIGDDEHPPLLPPERDLAPEREPEHRHRLERAALHGLDGNAMEGHGEPRSEGSAVTVVAVEKLEHPGGLAERSDPLLDAAPVDRVDDPDAAAYRECVRRSLEAQGLVGDPAEAEWRLVARAELHFLRTD